MAVRRLLDPAVLLLCCVLCLAGCATPPAGAPGESGGTAPPPPETTAKVPATPEPTAVSPVESKPPQEPAPINPLYFEPGSTDIDNSGLAFLREQARRLTADKELRVTVVGMTDDRGSPAYNLALADRRINEVMRRLRRFGVEPGQMRRHNAGAETGRLLCRTKECRRARSRVELRYRKRH